jgi:adenylate cyclase
MNQNNHNLATYLPQDRRRALARGENLPDRAHGSVLFADISGFTPFTEALRHAYGARRGAEELTNHLDTVYTALIAEVERYGGSVTGFSGDAITCWFGDGGQGTGDGGRGTAVRAVACAVALQTAMAAFAEIALPNGEMGRLTIKIGIATGEVRRLVVGADYWLDVLAGETVNRTAVAEQLASAPEILLDQPTIAALGSAISLSEWRSSEATGERFGVLGAFTGEVAVLPVEPLPELGEEVTRPWLNPLVYEREKTGHALLQTDFRPCVALFVRFVGIDYEAGSAAEQLDQFIRPLQAILAHYEGALIDLTFGDKGSYAYINFGALTVHEDDARRAAKTALHLCDVARQHPVLAPLQIGLTRGVMRTGAYGGISRRHYGALGDEVNVAARLMSTAVPDQILVSDPLHEQLRHTFLFGAAQQLSLKGRRKPLTAFPLHYEQTEQRPINLPEPSYNSPMIGREKEQLLIAQKLGLTQQGQSQIVALVGEAGLGKSRLALQTVLLALRQGFTSYGGACQADGLNTPYLVWKQLVANLFGLDAHQPPATQILRLQEQVRQYAPERAEALPLLGRLLDLPIPENSFTQGLESKNRQTVLHALLEDCLKRFSQQMPLLLVVEDLHWIDALSHDLLVELTQSCAAYPIFFLIVYRPTTLLRLQAPRLEARPNFTPILLSALDEAEARQLIQAKLHQLYPIRGRDVSPVLVQKLLARAEGNPFYLEELLNFLHGRGLDPRDETSWETELPDSLHALILSRLDQLTASQKRTMRVASIIGRLFSVSWLIGYYPALGDLPQLQADLTLLHNLDLTLLDRTEPELEYLFKHVITHEVTYESLPYATRARLHEQLAHYLEEIHAPLDSIAYHYGQSDNRAKKISYWQQAAEAAQASYANEAALAYYEQLLPLVQNSSVEAELRLKQGTIMELLGRWQEAEQAYQTALSLSSPTQEAAVCLALGRLYRFRGVFDEALVWLARAEASGRVHQIALLPILLETGFVLVRKRQLTEARVPLQEGLLLASQAADFASTALALNNLGNAALAEGDYEEAKKQYEESLALRRQLGDRMGMADSLNNLGLVAMAQQDLPLAQTVFKESLQFTHEIGYKHGLVAILGNLGVVAVQYGDYDKAQERLEATLSLARELGDLLYCSVLLNELARLRFWQGDIATAEAYYAEMLIVSHQIKDQPQIASAECGLGMVALAEGRLAEARPLIWNSLHRRQDVVEKEALVDSLVGMAEILWREGQSRRCAQLLGGIAAVLATYGIAIRREMAEFHAKLLTAVRQNLSPTEFEAAWAEGETMNLEQAIHYALEETTTHE